MDADTHTPGPWKRADLDTYPDATDEICAEGYDQCLCRVLQEPIEANAALIAAAPALLSALRACFEVLDCNWTATNGQGISDEEHGARHMARAAISAATGAGNGGGE